MIYTINGTEYVLIKVPIKSGESEKKLDKAVDDFNGIYQDIEIMFRIPLILMVAKVSVLVPSDKAKEFSDKVYK